MTLLRGSEDSSHAGFMAFTVFQSLDRAFLAAPDALQLTLDQRLTAGQALAALERIGPAAAGFVAALLRRLRESTAPDGWESGIDGSAALSSIGRGDASVVDALIEGLKSPDSGVRCGAVSTLT